MRQCRETPIDPATYPRNGKVERSLHTSLREFWRSISLDDPGLGGQLDERQSQVQLVSTALCSSHRTLMEPCMELAETILPHS